MNLVIKDYNVQCYLCWYTLSGTGHVAVTLDVADVKSVEDTVHFIKERYGEPPRICVNCAGIALHSGVLENDDTMSDKVIDINLKASEHLADFILLTHLGVYLVAYLGKKYTEVVIL